MEQRYQRKYIEKTEIKRGKISKETLERKVRIKRIIRERKQTVENH